MQDCPFCTRTGPDTSGDPESFYTEVRSWVTGPKLQSPVLREKTGRVAHRECIENLVKGQAADQPTFDEPGTYRVHETAEADRCEANTVNGICDMPLTPQGDCLNSENHLL